MNPIKHIRTKIFGLKQAEFAQLAGVASSSVSRWENGVPISVDEMRSIRDAARERGISWDDSWFFEVPESSDLEVVE
jgi:transcriptional regulator with XRE-family HTH domain